MKKNLRIVSAAAAALLAVAPVAASATVANAEVTVNGDTTKPAATAGTVTINAAVTATANKTTPGDAANSVKFNIAGATQNGAFDKTKVKIVDENGNVVSAAKLQAGVLYRIKYSNLQLNGLTTGTEDYKIAGGKVTTTGAAYSTAKDTASAEALKNGMDFYSDTFTLTDSELVGTPLVEEISKSTTNPYYVSKGSVELNNANASVSGLTTLITDKYQAVMTGINGVDNENQAKFVNTEHKNFGDMSKAIKSALSNNNIKLGSDENSFKLPATSFVINLTAAASNGKKVEFPVTVNVKPQSDAPKLSLNSGVTGYSKVSETEYNRSVAVNAAVSADSIKTDFNAVTFENSNVNCPVDIVSSNLNTSVAGKYAVVLSATNNNGKTTKVTVNVTVGNPGKTATVQAGSETAKIVTIDGNKVTETNDSLANGAQVATYKTITIDGVSYTQLNSADSNKYVQTKYVDGSIKEEKSESTMIMYKSAIYDKDGKSTGKTIYGYTDKDFVTTSNGNLKVVEIKGGNFYQLAKGEGYVRVRNVTGSKMTLKHNAYVYKSNGKRANKKLLKKGHTITVYGGQYKAIKKYRGKAVRIGVNLYVKLANVNYKLYK